MFVKEQTLEETVRGDTTKGLWSSCSIIFFDNKLFTSSLTKFKLFRADLLLRSKYEVGGDLKTKRWYEKLDMNKT